MSKSAEFKKKIRAINDAVEELWGCTQEEIDHLYRLLVTRNQLRARYHATKDQGSGATAAATKKDIQRNGAELREYLEGAQAAPALTSSAEDWSI